MYRFLDYYSKFDWNKYCISLKGPIAVSSLPQLSVETIDNDGGVLLLTEDFLKCCVDAFTVPGMGSEANSRPFIGKFLNIVDPLRENNNLGRSVNESTFHRIRSAFEYGAKILGRVLLLPSGRVRDGVDAVFVNTLGGQGVRERTDVQQVVPRLPQNAFVESSRVELVQPSEKPEIKRADEMSSESLTSKANRDLKELKSIRISSLDESEVIVSSEKALSHKHQNSTSGEASCIPSEHLASDIASSRTSDIKSVTEIPKTSSSTEEDGVLDFRNADHPPRQFFNPVSQSRKDLALDRNSLGSLGPYSDVPSVSALRSDEGIIISKQPDFSEIDSSLSNTGLVVNYADGYAFEPANFVYNGVEGNRGNLVSEPPLFDERLDLSGDFVAHFDIFNYAVWCQEKAKRGNFFPKYQPTPYYYSYGEDVWTPGGLFTGPSQPTPLLTPVYHHPVNLIPFMSSSNNTVRAPRPRGTGAFFPNMTYQAGREKYFRRSLKKAASADHPPTPQSNAQADIPQDMSSMDKESHEPASLSENLTGQLPGPLDSPPVSPQHASSASPEAIKIASPTVSPQHASSASPEAIKIASPPVTPQHASGASPEAIKIASPPVSSQHASSASPEAIKIASPPDLGAIQFGTFGPVLLETSAEERVRMSPTSEKELIQFGIRGSRFASPASSSQRPAETSSSIKETSENARKPQLFVMRDEDFPPL